MGKTQSSLRLEASGTYPEEWRLLGKEELRSSCDASGGAVRCAVRVSEWAPDGTEASTSREFEWLRDTFVREA